MSELSGVLYAVRLAALLVAMIIIFATTSPVWVALLAVFLLVSIVVSWLFASGLIELGPQSSRVVTTHFASDVLLAIISIVTAGMLVNKTITLVLFLAFFAVISYRRGAIVKMPASQYTPWAVEFATAVSLTVVLWIRAPYTLAATGGSAAIFLAAAFAATGQWNVVEKFRRLPSATS